MTTTEVDVHVALLAAEETHAATGSLPPVLIGGIAFGILIALLVVTYAFRNVHNRH